VLLAWEVTDIILEHCKVDAKSPASELYLEGIFYSIQK